MTRDGEPEQADGLDYSARERLAGAFVLVAALMLIGALAFSGQIAFMLADTFMLTAEVSSAEDITTDAAVKYAGIEIGKVTDVEMTSGQKILVTLRIREKHHELVRADSIATLNRLAILGDTTIEITRGDPDKPPIADGERIRVEETPTLDELLSRFVPVVDDVVATADHARAVVESIEPQSISGIMQDVESAVADMRALTADIRSGTGTVGRLLHDEQLAADVAANVAQLQNVLALTEARLRDLEPVLVNTAAGTDEFAELLDETTRLVDQVSGAVETLESQQGHAISGVLMEARNALDEAEKTLRAIRNTWPFSTNAPIEQPVQALPPQPPTE